MEQIEDALSLIKGFFNVHHASKKIRVRTAIQEIVDNEEPANSIRSVGKVHLLGYQYSRGNEELVAR